MKAIIILAIIILMAGIAFANDPNMMGTPTIPGTTITCLDGDVLWVKMKLTADEVTATEQTTFMSNFIRYIQSGINRVVANLNEEMANKLTLRQKIDALERVERISP